MRSSTPFGKNVLRSNLGSSKVKVLLIVLHNLPHIKDGTFKVHLSEANANWLTREMENFAH